MSSYFANQAIVHYENSNTNKKSAATSKSNISDGTWQDELVISKKCLETEYTLSDSLTFTISITNTTATKSFDFLVFDDLGTYVEDYVRITPLSYIPTAKLYINGVFSKNISPLVLSHSIIFAVRRLPANTIYTIQYKATPNDHAKCLCHQTSITNTAHLYSQQIREIPSSSVTIPAKAYCNLVTRKEMFTEIVEGREMIRYIFTISNFGNTESDCFCLKEVLDYCPKTNITVKLNNTPTTDFTYNDNKIFIFPALGTRRCFKIPAATTVEDPATKEITINPSVVVITLEGFA